MPFEAVTTHDVSRARFILEQAANTLLEADPQMRDDDALFVDMLDGEGGDALDLLRAALRASLDADAQALACCRTRMSAPGGSRTRRRCWPRSRPARPSPARCSPWATKP